MAIQKSKSLSNGASGNYWKITSITVDKTALLITAIINLFMDQTHGQAKTSDLGLSKTYVLPFVAADLEENIVALTYAKLLAKASSTYTPNPSSLNPSPSPITFDPDIAGGTPV